MYPVGADIGRNKPKIFSKDVRLSFPARVGEWRSRKLSSGGDYEVMIDGQKVFVGDLAAEESYFIREMASESKIHQETMILFFTALALIPTQDSFAVTIGLPIYQHDQANKDRLVELLSRRRRVKVNNGPDRLISIDRIGVAPEGSGPYWDEHLTMTGGSKQADMSGRMHRTIDVGSRTINYCTIKDRRYIDKDSGTLSYGVMELENADKNKSEEAKEQFARRIVADLSKRWMNYDPEIDIILLAGGGALLLGELLRKHFPRCRVAEDPVFANARGFFKMGVAKWGAN